MSRFLSGCTQRDVHATVVGQDEGAQFLESLLPFFIIQLRILFDRLFDLLGRQILIIAT
jgi:hypothetical protein